MENTLKRTSLFSKHEAEKAKLVPFAGWHMPLQYQGILEEHRAVRKDKGIFDLSHMGEIEVTGKEAGVYLDRLITGNLAACAPGQALYSVMCKEDGGILDDLVVYCMNQKYMLVVNASNTDKIYRWMKERQSPDEKVQIRNCTDEIALISVQGPNSQDFLQPFCSAPLHSLQYYHCTYSTFNGLGAMISRTGYTGEDGFELYIDANEAPKVWDALRQTSIAPIGLGARDTLRLEAGYLLYGNDMDETTSPLEVGLSWVVKLDKPDFIGKKALISEREKGIKRKLIPFMMNGKNVARKDYPVLSKGHEAGKVSSGTFSPTLEKGIGFAFVETNKFGAADPLQIEIRSVLHPAVVTQKPFVKGSVKHGSK